MALAAAGTLQTPLVGGEVERSRAAGIRTLAAHECRHDWVADDVGRDDGTVTLPPEQAVHCGEC